MKNKIHNISVVKYDVANGLSGVLKNYRNIFAEDMTFSQPGTIKSNSKKIKTNSQSKVFTFLKNIKLLKYLSFFYYARIAFNKLQKENIQKNDWILFHDPFSLFYATVLDKVRIKKLHNNLIFFNHSIGDPKEQIDYRYDCWFTRLITKFIFKFIRTTLNTSHILNLSQSALDNFNSTYGISHLNTFVIENYLPSKGKVNSESDFDNINIYIVGTISKIKRQIEILNQLPKDFYNIKLAGSIMDGFSMHDIEKIPCAEYLGILHKPYEMFKKGDILLSVSSSEGLPLSMIEALREGCVILATDVGGCNRVCINGKNGILLHKDFKISELIESLDNIIPDKKLIKQYSDYSLNLFEQHYSSKSGYDFFKRYFNTNEY
ncbi:glycosyltransferase family 4 protein [Chrysiogenes arsenatis]|uniref:glycosyltransferase family 4 protein n=1 Tax=Chrysiogenes arsenatis TaxID=309797 RepID=UPI0003FD86B3|nr:glycosyltransferase family 4 protein [Chrysiogenes arsenatis]